MTRAGKTVAAPRGASKTAAKAGRTARKSTGRRPNFTDARGNDPADEKARRLLRGTGWRLMLCADVARIAGVTETTAHRILEHYAWASMNPLCVCSERMNFESTVLECPSNYGVNTIARVIAVARYLTDHLRDEADELGELLAKEAAFCMRLPDLPASDPKPAPGAEDLSEDDDEGRGVSP